MLNEYWHRGKNEYRLKIHNYGFLITKIVVEVSVCTCVYYYKLVWGKKKTKKTKHKDSFLF